MTDGSRTHRMWRRARPHVASPQPGGTATPVAEVTGLLEPGLCRTSPPDGGRPSYPPMQQEVDMSLGSFDRSDNVAKLGGATYDVLVVGGGITGAGVALDAASRGLSVALVERDDFASGTSSKSSKLVHGGLRYLQNGDVRLVYEALRERQRLRHNAPHLVRLLPFLIPIFSKDGLINPKVARALGSAMWMYDLTGGARIGKLHQRLKKAQAVAHMPTLPEERLAGAYLYYDAAADDARLTLTLVRTAVLDHGAVAANHARVVEMIHDGGSATG